MFSLSALTLLTLAAATSAHFTLDYPTSRGFDEDIEGNFCGGFNGPSANRSQFPLGTGLIVIDSHHPSANVLVTLAINDNPTSFDQFNTSANGGTVLPFFQIKGEGIHCFATDIGAMGIANAKDGATATIQVQFDGGDGNLFQCTDVILSSSATAPTDSNCTNGVSALPGATQTSSSSASTSTSTPSSGFKKQASVGLLVISLAGAALMF